MVNDHHRAERHAGSLQLQLLVLRCQAGDERAFATLLDEFGEKTLRYLRGLLEEDADDVQQEVWLAVFKGIAALTNPAAFRTWLFRTTRHRAIDFLGARKRERELIDDAAVDDVAAGDEHDDASTVDVGEITLAAAFAAIPTPQREVLLLRYRDDLTYEEIATVVGCPIGTVRTRLHHAKRRLRQLLHCEDP
jgi:RNA polymerase sigma-70 factor (ECF subfamily)